MNDLISIIIPVYNAEKYLGECLESICNQTYKNLQIIVVDDCSTDSSADIIVSFAEKDKRIEVYRPDKNGGQSASRNLGLKHAKGEWIGFVDNDDTIEPKMYETLINNAHKYNVKVSGCAHNIVVDGAVSQVVNLVNYNLGLNEPKEFLINALYKPKNAWVDVWTKLYHKSLICELNFPVGSQMEDFYVNFGVFSHLKSFCYTDMPFYNWRVLESSQSHSKYFDNRFTYYKVSEEIRKRLEKNNSSNDIIEAAYVFEYCCKTQLLFDMIRTKDKNTINLAKSKYKEVKSLSRNIKPTNRFTLKSYFAYKFRLLCVGLA